MAQAKTRRQFLKTIAATSATLALASERLAAKSHRQNQQPNLVIVFPDQMRGSAMGFLKEEPVITPHIDRFAKQSLVLTKAVSNYPVCSPYRAMLLTGKYPCKNKVLSNCNSNTTPFDNELQETDRCWSDVLKDEGYSLGYIGKWHLDSPHKPYIKSYNNSQNFAWNEWCPPNRRHGFDFWYSYGTFDQHMSPEYWSTNMKRDQRIKAKQWGPEHEADMAIKYIKNEEGHYRKADQPFALVVSMNPPHMPYGAFPKRYLEHYKNITDKQLFSRPNIPPADTRYGKSYRRNIRHYYAMITGVDEQFGRILQTLKQANLDDNTIVLFTSDHGDCLGIHKQLSKNNHHEESMRIPFMIRWPKHIKPKHDDLLISSPDIYPTLMGLMGLDKKVPSQVQGTSHANLMLGQGGKRPTSQLYLWMPAGKPAWGRRGVRTHRYTLMISKDPKKSTQTVLHDNVNDPWQMKNIALEQPEIVKKLVTEELNPWLIKTEDPWLNS